MAKTPKEAARVVFGNKEKKQFPDPEGLEREKPSSAIEGSTQPIGFETSRSRNKFSEAALPMPGARQTLNNRLQRVGSVRRGVTLAAPRKEEVDGNMENKTFTQFVTEAKRGRPRKLRPGEKADTEHLQDQLAKLTHPNHVVVHFADGSKHELPRGHANKALHHLASLKPEQRADRVEFMHGSHENFYKGLAGHPTPSKKKTITLAGPKLRKEETELDESLKDARKHRAAANKVGYKHPDFKKHMAAFHNSMADHASKGNLDGGKMADEHRAAAKQYAKEEVEQIDELHGKGSLEKIRDYHKNKQAEYSARTRGLEDTTLDRYKKMKSTVVVTHSSGKKEVIPGHGEAEFTAVQRNKDTMKAKRDLEGMKVKRATGLIKKRKSMKEDAEQIDEISKKTLASYVKKAGGASLGSVGDLMYQAANADPTAKDNRRVDLFKKAGKRAKGVERAATKLAKEETDKQVMIRYGMGPSKKKKDEPPFDNPTEKPSTPYSNPHAKAKQLARQAMRDKLKAKKAVKEEAAKQLEYHPHTEKDEDPKNKSPFAKNIQAKLKQARLQKVAKEEVEQIDELKMDKKTYVSAMQRTTGYDADDEEGRVDSDKLVARAKKYKGDKFAKDLEGAHGMAERPNRNKVKGQWGNDKLAWRSPAKSTSTGKANKTTLKALKASLTKGDYRKPDLPKRKLPEEVEQIDEAGGRMNWTKVNKENQTKSKHKDSLAPMKKEMKKPIILQTTFGPRKKSLGYKGKQKPVSLAKIPQSKFSEEVESDEKKKKDHHKLLQKFRHRIDEVKAIKGTHATKIHAAKVINPGRVGYTGKQTKPKVQNLHSEDYAPLEAGKKQTHVDQKTVDAKSRKQGAEKPKMEMTKEAWALYDTLSDKNKAIFEKMDVSERDRLVDKYISGKR